MYFLTTLEAGSPRSRCLQGQSLVRPPSLVLQVPFSLHMPAIFPLHTETALWRPSSYKDTSSLGSGSHPTTSFNLCYLHEEPISKEVHIRTWGFNTWIWRETVQRMMTPHNRLLFGLFKGGNSDRSCYVDEPWGQYVLNEINQLQKDRYVSHFYAISKDTTKVLSPSEIESRGTCMVVQWWRICLPMQEVWVWSGQGTKIPHALEQLSPFTTTTEPSSLN